MADPEPELPERSSLTGHSIGCLLISMALVVLVVAALAVVAWSQSSSSTSAVESAAPPR